MATQSLSADICLLSKNRLVHGATIDASSMHSLRRLASGITSTTVDQ